MIIQFKDREKELSELGDVLNSRRFEFIILYGRRRIGKTELILKATENKGRIYYLAVGARNPDRFHSLCARHYPEVSKLKTDWEVLFEFLKNKAEVVVIDEFQNMIHEDANILNIFQSIIDITLKDSELKLFLLGSSVSIMTSKVLDYTSPLYGRRTGSMALKAVSFFDLERFFPVAGTIELVEIYGFADGIPFYLIKIDRPFWQWLEGELTKERSLLRDEVDFLMR
jgi:AAA+ ATPase superfamily predicted ATPase